MNDSDVKFQLILALWTIFSPMNAVVMQTDPLRPSKNYTVCSLDDMDGVFIGILGLYKVIPIKHITIVLNASPTACADHLGLLLGIQNQRCW
jgi:hypothetical protein